MKLINSKQYREYYMTRAVMVSENKFCQCEFRTKLKETGSLVFFLSRQKPFP